ncbi:MAG: hypothetical protein ACRCWJ_11565 [Casimicrobium sp.]
MSALLRYHVLFSLLVASFQLAVSAQTPKPPSLIDLITDKGCGIVPEVEKDNWRDANGSDYQSDEWKQWLAQTKASAPWRTEGDFDGDGLTDVAKVVIRKSDNAWMMGVEFGYKNKSECRRFQIASNSTKPKYALPAVLTIRRDQSSIVCAPFGKSTPLNCSIDGDFAKTKRDRDVIVMSDATPTYVNGFVWQQWQNKTRNDGSPWMIFGSTTIETGTIGYIGEQNTSVDASRAQAGDRVSADERKKVVAEFDEAYRNQANHAYRAQTTIKTADGIAKYIAEYLPGKAYRTSVENVASSDRIVTTIIDGQAFTEFGKEKVQRMGAAPLPVATDASIGTMTIRAVTRGTQQGKPIKTLQLYEKTKEQTVLDTVTIDEKNKLPLKRVTDTDNGASVITTTFDYSVTPSISAPK